MKHILILSFLLFSVTVFAQSNFQKGYVVIKPGDTILGEVDYKERGNNQTYFRFRDSTGTIKKLSLSDCVAYGIYGIEDFERYYVVISLNNIALNYLSIGPNSNKTTDTVFLRTLLKGENVNLYAYADKLKERYYIKENDNTVPTELYKQVYLNPEKPSEVMVKDNYATQLLMIMRKYKGGITNSEQKLVDLTYTEYDLKKIVAIINGKKLERIKPKYNRLRFFGGAGLTRSANVYEESVAFPSPNNKSVAYSPYILIGADLFFNPAVRKLVLRADFYVSREKHGFNKRNTYVSSFDNEYNQSFEQLNAVLTPQIIYHLYNAKSVKFFLSAGVAINFVSYKKEVFNYTIYYPGIALVSNRNAELRNFQTSFPLGAGLVIAKNFELTGSYTPASSITSASEFTLKADKYKIGVNYLFGKQ